MKKLTEAKKNTFDLQDNTINFINAADLKKYLEIADKFISDETKDLVQWLIVNNDTYISDLSNDEDENALAGFYKAGVPKDPALKELYKLLGTIIRNGRQMEIPVFQTKAQFESIINKKEAPDAIILDLTTERGRAAIAKKYEPLVHHIARQWVGKINMQYEDLVGFCYEGLTYAMNTYGKKNKRSKADDEAIVKYTFGQYAAYCMRNQITGNGVNFSHIVHIPNSQQKKEREEKGHNRKNISISGDKAVGHDDDGGKSLFDFMGSTSDVGKNLDRADLDRIWKRIFKIIEENFDKKVYQAWFSFYGLNGYKKLKNKEIAAKYKVSNSNINYYCSKVTRFLKGDPKIKKLLEEAWGLMKECLHDADVEETDNETTFIRHLENPMLDE
jgi:RNA polymerase sigma factor (sigma-70 family)